MPPRRGAGAPSAPAEPPSAPPVPSPPPPPGGVALTPAAVKALAKSLAPPPKAKDDLLKALRVSGVGESIPSCAGWGLRVGSAGVWARRMERESGASTLRDCFQIVGAALPLTRGPRPQAPSPRLSTSPSLDTHAHLFFPQAAGKALSIAPQAAAGARLVDPLAPALVAKALLDHRDKVSEDGWGSPRSTPAV